MKICFLARPTFDIYSAEIFNHLCSKDGSLSGVFVTTNKSESNSVRTHVSVANEFDIYETASYLKEHWDEFSLEKLTEYELKYDCAPIWKYIYTDRFLVNCDYSYVVKITAGLFSFFEYIFTHSKPQYYYSECIATLQCYVAYLVGNKLGVRYITQMCARGSLDSTFHYFTTSPFQYNCELNDNYLNVEYSKEEKERAEKYLFEFENGDLTPDAMKMVKTQPRINREYILAPLRYLKHRFDAKQNDPYAYMYFKQYKNCLNPVIFYHRYKQMKKLFCSPDYSRKYVYYPLHYQPEGSTCVCANKYENQLFYIDSFAKSLPADTVLYVKEHYTLLGHKGLEFYKSLSKFPNVFLIDPWENSRKMIQNSVAVTTLTGTAGLEAALLRKPVFVGGNAVYENAPGVIKVNDIYQGVIPALEAWKQPDREDIVKYLCACFRTYRKGNIYCQNYHELLDDNIDAISDSLYSKLREWENTND